MAETRVEILKRDDEKRLVFGFASVIKEHDGSPTVDWQGDTIDEETLEAAVYNYVLKSRVGSVMHEREDGQPVQKGRLVESFVITKEKLSAMGLSQETARPGWWFGMRVDDDAAWEAVKQGDLRMFSIGGRAEITEDDTNG